MNTNTTTNSTTGSRLDPPTTTEWLAGLGIDAVEVDACPVADCAVCRPVLSSAA
jgi:hypothetical protein